MRLYEFATETNKPVKEQQLNEWLWLIPGALRIAPYLLRGLSYAFTAWTAVEIYDVVWKKSGATSPEEFGIWYDMLTPEKKWAYHIEIALCVAGIVVPFRKATKLKELIKLRDTLKGTKEGRKVLEKAAANKKEFDLKYLKTQKVRKEPTIGKGDVDVNALGKGKIKAKDKTGPNFIEEKNLTPQDFGVKPKFQISKDGKTVIDLKTGKPVQKDTGLVGASGRSIQRNVRPDEFDIGGA